MSSRTTGNAVARTLALAIAAVLLPCCQTDIGTGDEPSQVTARISQRQGDIEVRGFSYNAFISGTGRYVVFDSDADDLASGDINTNRDVFLKDRTDGSVTIVTIRDPGNQAFLDASAQGVSDDGQRILFSSIGDFSASTNTNITLFLRDLASQRTIRITGTVDADNVCWNGSLSPDGRFVAFQSAATNLGIGAPTTNQIYLAELPAVFPAWPGAIANPTLTLVSRSTVSGTTPSNGNSSDPRMVGNGPAVVFDSSSTNLPSGVAVTGNTQCYLAVPNTATPNLTTVEIVSLTDGVAGVPLTTGGASSPTASADGRYICFETTAANIQPIRLGVRDRLTGATLSAFDEPYLGGLSLSKYPRISASGRFVVFWSGNSPLGDAPPAAHAYLRDLQAGFERLSVDTFGALADTGASIPQISADDRWTVFQSSASNLVVGDTNGMSDVFVRGPRY